MKICTMMVCALVMVQVVFAQQLEKDVRQQSISVLDFGGWQGSGSKERKEYQNILSDKITTKIIKSHRFRVIDRSHLEKVMEEQKLQMSGLVNEATMVQIGQIMGVEKFIVGNFTRNSTEYFKAEYYEGKKIKDAYYTAQISATIKMLDIETAVYVEAIEAEGRGKGKDKRNALMNALEKLSINILTGFEEYFKIQAFITKLDNSIVILDRGTVHGVLSGMSFEVYETSDPEFGARARLVGKLKVVSAERSNATGRLFGDFSAVKTGYLIRETKDEIKVEATILEKSFGSATVNVGADLGIKIGTKFKVIELGKELIDPTTGEKYGQKKKEIGIISISEVGPSFSRGKIVEGRYSIEEGMQIMETNRILQKIGFSILYGYYQATVEVNNSAGHASIADKYTGSHEIDYDFSDYEGFDQNSFFEISGYSRDMVNNIGLDLNLSYLGGTADLTMFSLDGHLAYNQGVIPEYLYITPRIGLGIGSATLRLPGSIVSDISDGEDKSLRALSVYFSGSITTKIIFSGLVVTANVGYKTLEYSDWDYTVKTGKKTENDVDETESISLDDALVPYPSIKIPLHVSIGIAIEL
jgi:hypothetical protein